MEGTVVSRSRSIEGLLRGCGHHSASGGRGMVVGVMSVGGRL